jgi:hypothetical protein
MANIVVNQIEGLNQLIGTPKDSHDVRKKLYTIFEMNILSRKYIKAYRLNLESLFKPSPKTY